MNSGTNHDINQTQQQNPPTRKTLNRNIFHTDRPTRVVRPPDHMGSVLDRWITEAR